MAIDDPEARLRCEEWGPPVATDQASCLVCGARARPIPARVAVAISDIEDHGHAIAPDDPILSESDEEPEDDEESRDDLVSSARAGVIALLAMLAVGVVIGGLTSSG